MLLRLLLAFVALCAPAALAAQGLAVTGRVVDVQTGSPVAGAVVELPDHRLRSLTDTAGTFALRGIPVGEHRWTIRALGYAPWEETTEVDDGERLTIRLMPHAIALETVRVRADRLERRRITSTQSTRVVQRREILTTPAASTLDLILYRALPMRVPCPGGPGGASSAEAVPCTRFRGSVVRVRLCIDEQPATFDELVAYFREEIYAIESYGGGTTTVPQVRVYTVAFVESTRPLRPIGAGC
jgi:hypothetical protein